MSARVPTVGQSTARNPNMKNIQFIHTYKTHKGMRRPVITTALKLDRDDDGNIRGLAIGFSYCSHIDHPNKKVGRLLATQRAERAIKEVVQMRDGLKREQFESDDDFALAKTGIAAAHRTRYGANKTELNENNEPYQTGHPHFSYVPLPVDEQVWEFMEIPDEPLVEARIVLALSNIEKFGQL